MKVLRIMLGACLLLASLLLIFPSGGVLAQETTPAEQPPDTVKLTATYTKLEGTAGSSFEFEVKITYNGQKDRIFDLAATGPKDWQIYITPSYPKDKQIKDVMIEGQKGYAETILVNASTPLYLKPDPGEYKISLTATSQELTGSIDLTAVITAKYDLTLKPSNQLYNTKVTAGKDNFFSVDLNNDGTAPISDITFSSDKPEGWTIEFTPKDVSTLAADQTQTIDVNIKPTAKAIAGDYSVSFRAASAKATAQNLEIRVTVETPTIWGWTGVGIIVVVIAGLAFIIMRFSRR